MNGGHLYDYWFVDSNWRARRAKLGMSACSTNWYISAVKSICPSSSSGWIIQIQHYFIIKLYSAVTSWDWLFIQLEGTAIIPWSETYLFVFFSTEGRTYACFFYSSQNTLITLPLEEGPLSLSIKQVISNAPFLEGVFLHGRIELRTLTFWAIEPSFLLHATSITARGVL